MFSEVKPRHLPAFHLIAAVLLLTSGRGDSTGQEQEPVVTTTLYHHDPEHLWNRVHAALFIRLGPDGRAYGEDRLEPLLWNESIHLLKGKSAARAVSVLEQFARERGETLADDPVKRAMLQRDLWLVFQWLARDRDALMQDPARKRLGVALAGAIRRLALTSEQIARLPDNYASAVAARGFSERFDPEEPEQSYLPPDLFNPDGPWVCVGPTDGPTAPVHLDEGGGNRFTNSVFLVFLKLPDGRAATLDFLKRLAEFAGPLYLANADANTKQLFPNLPNPALPPWPKGTEVALVRQALLIDSNGRIVPSPLTEKLQLRVMRTDTPAMTAQAVEELGQAMAEGYADRAQAFVEFQLRRTALFAGRTGGLRDVSGERDFKTGFNAYSWDEFQLDHAPDRSTTSFLQRSQLFRNQRATCIGCHPYPGVYIFNSFHGDFPFTVGRELRDGRDGDYVPRSFPLAATSRAKVAQAAVAWKESRPGWQALKELLSKE